MLIIASKHARKGSKTLKIFKVNPAVTIHFKKMNKIPVICRRHCDSAEVKIIENSTDKRRLDSVYQLSYDLLNEAVKEIKNADPESENLKEEKMR